MKDHLYHRLNDWIWLWIARLIEVHKGFLYSTKWKKFKQNKGKWRRFCHAELKTKFGTEGSRADTLVMNAPLGMTKLGQAIKNELNLQDFYKNDWFESSFPHKGQLSYGMNYFFSSNRNWGRRYPCVLGLISTTPTETYKGLHFIKELIFRLALCLKIYKLSAMPITSNTPNERGFFFLNVRFPGERWNKFLMLCRWRSSAWCCSIFVNCSDARQLKFVK